jgi:hypothetical protein
LFLYKTPIVSPKNWQNRPKIVIIKLAPDSEGPALGSALYVVGGFTLPYIVVSSMAFVMAVVLALVVPKVTTDDKKDGQDSGKKSVTFSSVVKVCTWM